MKMRLAVIVTVVVVAAGVRLLAHHSFAAQYDPTKALRITGTLSKVEWGNPHTYFYIDVADEKTGKVTNWGMEMGSPNGLMRAGWTRNTMQVGHKVTVEGSLAKDGSHTGNARAVTMTDTGQRLFAASSQGSAAN